MYEVYALFKNYIITHAVTENAMIAQARITAWLTRFPHAVIEETRVQRDVKHDGYEMRRTVTEFRIQIRENVPDDLRA